MNKEAIAQRVTGCFDSVTKIARVLKVEPNFQTPLGRWHRLIQSSVFRYIVVRPRRSPRITSRIGPFIIMKKIIVIALFSLLAPFIKGQNKEIVAKFDVYLDNKKIESDSIYVGMSRSSEGNPKLLRITDTFTTFLEPNYTYKVVISHPGYQKQILKVDATNSYKNLNFKIYLNKNEPDCFIGYLKYNKKLNKYESY